MKRGWQKRIALKKQKKNTSIEESRVNDVTEINETDTFEKREKVELC